MSDTKLGCWTGDDLGATVKRYNGTRYYQSLPEEAQFVHSVAKVLSMRHAKDKTMLCSAPSLYILGPVPTHVGVPPKREPTFSMGGVNVSGKIWFGASAMNSSTGFPAPSGADADGVFTYVSKTLSAGGQPAVYFDGSANEFILRFYPKGVDTPEDCQDILLGGAHITEATLRAVLDRIHELSLITPTASLVAGKLWKDTAKCHPIERAENEVQGILEVGLAQALGNVRVKREGTGAYGRYDLTLLEQDPLDSSKITNHAILELKVIKSFTSTGKKVSDAVNQTAVLKGLKQAFAYRKEHGSRISALCCFDMRPDPNLQQYPEGKCKVAADLDVQFWAWPLFHKTEAARERLVETHLAKPRPP